MEGHGALPSFVIVGAQKAGSTNLAAALSQHPSIYLPGDEVPFFEQPFFERSAVHELHKVLRRAGSAAVLGIKRPDYFARAECAPNIASMIPSAKIVVSLRDPVSRAVSAHAWYVRESTLPLEPVHVGLTRLLEGDLPEGHPHAAEILEYGLYGRHLRRWLDVFPREQVHVVFYEELRADPAKIADVQRFLGVPPHAPDLDRSTNEGVYDMRRLRWLRLGQPFRFHWDNEKVYRARRRRLRRPFTVLPRAAIAAVDRLVLAPLLGNDPPVVPDELRRRLVDYYADDSAALAQLLGRELPFGSFASA